MTVRRVPRRPARRRQARPDSLAPPVASFRASKTTVGVGEAVSFTDTSSPQATAWFWFFGDGGFATGQNPQHTFAASGTYGVQLHWRSTGRGRASRRCSSSASIPPRRCAPKPRARRGSRGRRPHATSSGATAGGRWRSRARRMRRSTSDSCGGQSSSWRGGSPLAPRGGPARCLGLPREGAGRGRSSGRGGPARGRSPRGRGAAMRERAGLRVFEDRRTLRGALAVALATILSAAPALAADQPSELQGREERRPRRSRTIP